MPIAMVGNFSKDHAQVMPISLFVAVLCLCLIIGHLLEKNRWVNESITAIFLGIIAGTIILVMSKGKSSHILTFDEELFFIYLLPPIIFNAGFQVKKKQFFHNFLTIMLFGVVGVFISTSIITCGSWWLFSKLGFNGLNVRDFLAIGTIFSSTDTVCTLQVLHQDETPLLYSLVFGEGVVNDATSVVLFNAIQKIDITRFGSKTFFHVLGDFLYLFFTSTVLGIVSGLLTSYVLKTLCFGRHSSIREIALMVLMAYLSYMLAELFNLSGILTVFFCGILMSHYAWHNVAETSRITTRNVFAMMSFVAETFIFLYVGMDALDMEKWKMSKLNFGTSISIWSTLILLVSLGRAAFVFPLSVLSNYMNESHSGGSSKLTFKHMIVIWWAGLMRGAVSIALAFEKFTFYGVTSDPINASMITVTIIVVLFSTVVFGLLTKPLISCLLPHHMTNVISRERSKDLTEDLTPPLLSFEESATTNILRAKNSLSMLIERPVYTIHSYWRRFDDAYMRPIFGGPRENQLPT
ncbi:sodium/hydrogen exchanger 4 [Humulus lupulus]|uniref:sodium/hydrogen exchanger 4 n=1 Tax=Humulus lupulus TaxID=3486 RepID=UPI002B40BA42|nr:sodium/hydrogen exchanger 4 [Humulus lupulus]